MATGTENYFNNPGFADLEKKTGKYFVQDSVNPGTLGSEVVQGEFAIDDSLVAFDTSPVFTDYSQPNNPEVPEVEIATVETATTVKTIRGANYDVINSKERALSNITFIPGTACAMSEAIAYIRYWSRKGTQQKQPVDQEPQNGKPTDAQKALQDEMNEKYFSSADESLVNPEFGSGEVTGSETRVIAKVPDNTAYQSRPRQPVPTRVPVPATISQPLSGNTYSANPSGALATTPFIIPAEAVWTFLFNPEELQLSSGPDFNRAETWGVSDQANSGQPLSWRSNKNRKLTFSKVLLHGYSFGKRVDSLERGLQELFTARDGENGADGPPVLEFVWGKRVFGPCVIQNVQVREKAWDNGLLVNAEVSFDLEQVPEWTINDGFVDVLRPGRQSTVNDPLVPASTAEPSSPTTTPEQPPASKPGGGGGKQPDSLNLNEVRECEKARELYNNFKSLEEKAIRESISKPNSDISVIRQKNAIINYVEEFNRLWFRINDHEPKMYSIYRSLIKSPTGPEGFSDRVYDAMEAIKENTPFLGYPDYRDAAKLVVSVVNSYKVASDTYSKSQVCKKAFDQISKSQKKAAEQAKKAEEEAQCKARNLGAKCSGFAPTTTCSGIRLRCNGSTYQRF